MEVHFVHDEKNNALNSAGINNNIFVNATLTPEQQFERDHAGHEDMHAKMFMFFIFVLMVSQFLLLYWKHKHFASYRVFYKLLKI